MASISHFAFLCVTILSLSLISEGFISKSHKSGWGGFEKRDYGVWSHGGRFSNVRTPQRLLARFHMGKTDVMKRPNTNFIGSVFDESFEPEKQSFVDSDFVMPEGLDDLDMSLTDLRTRENVAEMMLGLCCEAEDFCLQDLWAEICDSLHLDQTTCFPLYHQKCSRIGGAEPSGK
ncbi:uncharacterized protein LOC134840080 [Symsagittifera roscoffensis]|uniref:uncharacterized protein LOC134840080 n=1 Tax=Symsagittifera roscoffensis TaxID=84072 RepID=UPI00307BC9C6